MTKRTRLFLSIAAGVLVAGLGTGLVASYMGGFQGLTIVGGDGPEELAYVPSDARFVAYADVRDVMSSEVRRKLSLTQPGTNTGANIYGAAATTYRLDGRQWVLIPSGTKLIAFALPRN